MKKLTLLALLVPYFCFSQVENTESNKSSKFEMLLQNGIEPSSIQGAVYSPDNQYCIIYNNNINSTQLWTKDHILLKSFSEKLDKIVFSQDGKSFFCYDNDSDRIKRYSIDGTKADSVSLWVDLLGINTDNTYLAYNSKDGSFKVREYGGAIVQEAIIKKGLKDWTGSNYYSKDYWIENTSAFSKNYQYLATVHSKIIKVWNLKTGVLLYTFKHDNPICNVIFSPNGQYLASYDYDGSVRKRDEKLMLWDLSNGSGVELKFPESLLKTSDVIGFVEFSKSGTVIIAKMEATVAWDLKGNILEKDQIDKNDFGFLGIHNCLYSPVLQQVSFYSWRFDISIDNKLIERSNNSTFILDLNNLNTTINPAFVELSKNDYFSFTPDGKFFLIPTHGLTKYDLFGNFIKTFRVRVPDKWVFLENDQIVGINTFDPIISLFDKDGNVLKEFQNSESLNNDIIAHPDGKHFITAGYSKNEGKILIWNTEQVNPQVVIPCAFNEIGKIKLSPDGETIIVVPDFSKINMWDFTGKKIEKTNNLKVKDLCFSPNGEKIYAISDSRNELQVFDQNWNYIKDIKSSQSHYVNISISKDGNLLIASSYDGLCLVNTKTEESVDWYCSGSDWFICTSDNYWDASPNGAKLIAMVKGDKGYRPDQFAAKYNRPDIILKRMGLGTPELIAHYENQYKKRLRKLGLTEDQLSSDFHVPTAIIINEVTKENITIIKATLSDDKYNLKKYNVFVNDVPLYGSYGKEISGMNADITANIELTNGNNKIEVSCINEKGVESYRALTYANYNGETNGDLYLLAFGVSKYQNPTYNLAFADKDAVDLSKAIESYKGKGFENIYTKILTNEQVTPEAIKASKDFVKNAKPDDTFILFIAGHGMHDKDAEATYYYLTSNADINNLKGTAADFETIEDLLQGIPPRNKLFLMDACESGEIDEEDQGQMIAAATGVGIASRGLKKVNVTGAEVLEATEAATSSTSVPAKRSYLYQKDRYIYNDLVRRSGAIVFSSSKGGELSYERSDIENGLFTEYIMKALTTNEADKDGNGTVSTDELRNYVSAEVAKASGDLQHPTVDRDNIYQKFGFQVK